MATLNTIKAIYKDDIGDFDDKEMLRLLRGIPWIALQAQSWADHYYNGKVKREKVQAYLLQRHEYDAVDISKIIMEAKTWRSKAIMEKT